MNYDDLGGSYRTDLQVSGGIAFNVAVFRRIPGSTIILSPSVLKYSGLLLVS